MDEGRSRFPQWVYSSGEEPDPRFSLANERTFLAWIRTSLALMAGGVALQVFRIGGGAVPSVIASILLIAFSVLLPLHAWWAWATVERRIRRAEPLPSARLSAPLAVVLSVAGVLVLWSVVS